MGQIIAIMLGGAIGAVSRYGVSQLMAASFGRSFPYGTLTVNVLGSFLMGYLSIYFMNKVNLDPMIRLTVLVGFLGAFTTFSTFSMDTLNLIQSGFVTKAFLNILLNVTCSLTAVWVGVILAR
ncbi:fluoride efflux transporter CrcB [Leucothrix arctica]|uniref:Fluoride-specific ion channel FluC n=1 Tax=Leucothrix arctica TaxID=1481894 RepID=A0A317CJJ8_9GAMM|nr:fluoride efflux transporter CrcB [Leucothrix arctica]PWQ98361.1 fluoride efflux transporter CrcB [Leucothrix arctica]